MITVNELAKIVVDIVMIVKEFASRVLPKRKIFSWI